jgi:hypothetical protein
MRKVIEAELRKSPALRAYFENWGSRCYVFSSELGVQHDIRTIADPPRRIQRLEIDGAALRSMGADYVFSALPIENHLEIGLKPIGVAGGGMSPSHHLKLWVYQLAPCRASNRSRGTVLIFAAKGRCGDTPA